MKLKFKGEQFQHEMHQHYNLNYKVQFGIVHHQKNAPNQLQPNHL